MVDHLPATWYHSRPQVANNDILRIHIIIYIYYLEFEAGQPANNARATHWTPGELLWSRFQNDTEFAFDVDVAAAYLNSRPRKVPSTHAT
jgi:hypothetical protein